ncbi:MAG: ribonuclease catalytic domain-containing protein, partial [Giesbergeria sp.]
PLAEVQAFSIDDSQTTEIDDALSVTGLGTGTVTLGIHIAAPGLAIAPGSAIDQLGRQRLSTVYMPGYKLTMLPDSVVQIYTLDEGRDNPAVSLYCTIDEATLEITATETRLDRVPVVANLRHDQLDHIVTEDWLREPSIQIENTPQRLLDLRPQLSFLYGLAQRLKAGREVVRGKPENFNRPDYNFRLLGGEGGEPSGSETVQITTRQRGAPLDLIVAEAAIVANSTWGQWLASLGVPGIYRSQASMAPGVKVRMGTKALPHAGMGVKSYTWATSPLRRYVDLVNQWQIIACARHGATAALAAPFKPKDAELFSIISSFDATYSAYNGYQAGMERFWTLKYLEQNGITELEATVFKEGPGGSFLVRADALPLVFPVLGAQNLPRGARLRVKLGEVDEITLDLHGTVLERLDDPLDTSDDGPVDDESDEDGEDGDSAVAGPIAIAVDMNDTEAAPAVAAAP